MRAFFFPSDVYLKKGYLETICNVNILLFSLIDVAFL